MSKNTLRAGAAAGAVVLSAGTGLATNLLTDRPSWGVGTAVAVLVIAGVALAVTLSMLEHRGSTPPPQTSEPDAAGQSGFRQYAYSAGGRTTQVGRDIRHGMPAGYVVLSLLIVAAVAVAALLVASRFALPPKVNDGAANIPASSTPEDLSYRLSASPGDTRTVNVVADASGQPDPTLTYWFIMEVNYGKGYIEYYPRWTMTGRSMSFDVQIPGGAATEYSRIGRVYGLDSTHDTQAKDRLARASSGANDYFEKAPGRPVSNAVNLPY
jgi:hypothetical protein